MRTRTGFVSNSSTSSFILAVDKKKTKEPLVVRIEVNLNDFVDTTICYPNELEKYIRDNPDMLVSEADTLRRIVASGKALVMGRVDIESIRGTNSQLAELVNGGSFEGVLKTAGDVIFYGRRD